MIDFSRIHAMNALTTSTNIRRRRGRIPLVLLVLAAAVTLITLVD